jgi:hypothetical protein
MEIKLNDNIFYSFKKKKLPDTDRFNGFSLEDEPKIMKMFEDAFKFAKTQEFPNAPPEYGYGANTTPKQKFGVTKSADFTQVAFNNIKKYILENDTKAKFYLLKNDLHAYISEYYYWKVFNISLNWEDSLQVAKDRKNFGFFLCILQGILFVIPGCSNWKDLMYKKHPGILPYEIELQMSVLFMFSIYLLLPLPAAFLPNDTLLEHSIKYNEIAEDHHQINHTPEVDAIDEERPWAQIFTKEYALDLSKDIFFLKDFRKLAGPALHEMHTYIQGQELKRGFISFVVITSFLTFLMYFMQGDGDVSMNHLPHWAGFENIMHNMLLVAKGAFIDMGGRTRGWGINNVFYGECDQTWTKWFSNKLPTDFVMLLVLCDIKLFKMFIVGLVKMLSRQSYLQWFFKWARGTFMSTYDPSDVTGNLKKMAAPVVLCFTGGFFFHLISEAQKLKGAVNFGDYGDIAGILGLLAFMYPVFLMPNASYKQLKNSPYRRFTGNETPLEWVEKTTRNNAGSVILYAIHTLSVGWMCAQWLGLGTPHGYFLSIGETFMVLPGYYGILFIINIVIKLYKKMLKKFWKPVGDEEFGEKITLSNGAKWLTWGFLFIAIISLASWNHSLKMMMAESGEGENAGAIKEIGKYLLTN